MNSFRPLVYLSISANATRCFCRVSGLVQGLFATAIAIGKALNTFWRRRPSCPHPTSVRVAHIPTGANIDANRARGMGQASLWSRRDYFLDEDTRASASRRKPRSSGPIPDFICCTF